MRLIGFSFPPVYFLSRRVWREWIVEGDRFAGMLFEMGEKCTNGDRSVKVRVMAHNYTP